MQRRAMLAMGWLPLVGVASFAAEERPVLDAGRDPRLGRRIKVRSEGIPLAWVLKRLSKESGVALSASGSVGDERLVAFVPDAALSEVLTNIASLYRLDWSRGSGERPAYRLYRRPSIESQERKLRETALREVLEKLTTRLTRPSELRDEAYRNNVWTQLLPRAAPILESRIPELLRDGFAYVPLSSLPPSRRDPLTAAMQPVLDQQHAWLQQVAQLSRDRRAQEGKDPTTLGGENEPAPLARHCTLTLEVRLGGQLFGGVGLRTPHGSWFGWSSVTGGDLDGAALALYKDRSPFTPTTAGDEPGRRNPDDKGELDQPISLPKRTDDRQGNWIGELGRLSEASGLAVYSDCYPNHLQGIGGHPREKLRLAEKVSPRQALDAVCFPTARDGDALLKPTSFWWHQGKSAFVRSRRWLWESSCVIPASLVESLTDSVRRTGRIRPTDINLLASLNMFQVQSTGYVDRSMDSWQRAVRVTAQLSLPARAAALEEKGIAWALLPPPDQARVQQLLPAGSDPTGFQAHLKTSIHDFPGQGGTGLTVEAESGLPGTTALIHVTLPGVAATPMLEPRGLEIVTPPKP